MKSNRETGISARAAAPKAASRTDIVSPLAVALVLCTGASNTSFAQSAVPGVQMSLEPIIVEGTAQNPTEKLRDQINALPGGATLVTSDQFPDTANLTLSRALSTVPGVVVQDFFGGNDQPRVQIRGSGLQQNPVERGILVLQNGLPINRADGSYIVGFANPQQADSMEIYRGYLANRLGATVLGGAINFASPTGSFSPGSQVSVSGGSFGQANVAAQTGFKKDNVDGMLQADISRRDGYRTYNGSQRTSASVNVGAELSENVTTRFFAGYTELGFDVAGPLSKSQLQSNPRQVGTGPGAGGINSGPNVVRDRPRREADQFLIGSRTTATFGPHVFDVALGYTYTNDMFRFPITSGVRTTNGGDFTGLVRYAYKPNEAALLPLLESTAQYTVGSADRGYYLNQGGQTGAMVGANDLKASTLSLYSGLNVPVWQAFYVSPSISYSHATRENQDLYGLPTRPTAVYNPPNTLQPNGSFATVNNSYNRTYSGWNPSLALSYRPDNNTTLYTAVSHSFEPPTHDDLIALVGGTPNTSGNSFKTPDLKAQTATTAEAGWRGRFDRFSWDAVVYYSWVNNELLSLRDATGAQLGAINADKTTHFGVELGAGARLTDQISARVAYTYQDFRFSHDPVRGNNRLAGAPQHLINALLQYQATDAWRLQGAVRWSPSKTPVDNMNTLYADPYVVVDLRTEYKLDQTFTLFAEVTNVFNENYAASTLILDTMQRADQAAFMPGDGRGYFGGIKARF
ncbi:MAG: TonB-dependent receptor [Rhizobiales bacterium]|nr:TonB-dependent receptor [Hyphomicrobiales bacterium]